MKQFLTFLTFILTLPTFSFAQGSGHTGGSTCEIRILKIRNDILKWIDDGSAKNLDLRSVPGLDIETYTKKMKEQLLNNSIEINCKDAKDQKSLELKNSTLLHPIFRSGVFIDGKQKTCVNGRNTETGRLEIKCDFNEFYFSTPSDQSVLIHHEFASLAGIEVSHGSQSNYRISLQVPVFATSTVDVFEKTLKRKKLSYHFAGSLASDYSDRVAAEYSNLARSFIFDAWLLNLDNVETIRDKWNSEEFSFMRAVQIRLDALRQEEICLFAYYKFKTRVGEFGDGVHM